MTTLYTKQHIICKLRNQFSKIFFHETTQKHLFDIVLSVLNLNDFHSVKFNFDHFMQDNSDFKLKSYYYTLKESKIDLELWQSHLIMVVLGLLNPQSKQPIIISIDDTITEKFGKSFEGCSKLYDHAAHDGKLYQRKEIYVHLLSGRECSDF